MFRHHLEWAVRYALEEDYINRNYPNDANPNRRLRVGYVSADFRAHSVAYFMFPIILGHDRKIIEIYCYADVAKPDEVTQALNDKRRSLEKYLRNVR